MIVIRLLVAALVLTSQGSGLDAARGRIMLRELKSTLDKEYYDPTFGGTSLDERFAVADERLKTASKTSDVLSALALPFLDLEDSHTFFLPPPRAAITITAGR